MQIPSCSVQDIPFGAGISITSRAQFIYINSRLKPLGLTGGQFPVLLLLAKRQNIMQETLVRHYHLDKGTIARAVRKLEDRGYIRRITDPGNRRAVRLFLTKKGEQVIPVLHAISNDWETIVFCGLTGQEQEQLRALMRTVTANSIPVIRNPGEVSHDGE